jgi:ribosomal protein L28
MTTERTYGPLAHVVGQLEPVGSFSTPPRRHCPHDGPRPGWLLSKFHCAHDHALQVRYGITCDDYWRLWNLQGGRCAICGGRAGSGRKLVVDHDHDTGVIDGLCHFGCNRRLAQAFRRYLADPPGRAVGLVVSAAKLRHIEDMNKAKRAKARKRAAPPSDGVSSNLARLRAMTRQGGSR